MYILTLVLGIVAVAVGVASVGFGLSIKEFSFGSTLLITGTTFVVGGLVVVAVAAAIRELHRIAEALSARQALRPARPGERAEPYAPGSFRPPMAPPRMAPMPMVPVPVPQDGDGATIAHEHRIDEPTHQPAAPVEPLLPDLVEAPPQAAHSAPQSSEPPTELEEPDVIPLSPTAAPQAARSAEPSGEEPRPQPAPPAEAPSVSDDVVGEAHEPDSTPAKPIEHEPATPFDAIWPPIERQQPTRRSAETDAGIGLHHHHDDNAANAEAASNSGSESAPAAASDAPHQPRVAETHTADIGIGQAEPPHAVSILKSGVVDGMAYTLYSDGSIEAELPTGTIRFESIGALRAHLEQAE
jgi:hypothetical protein